MFKFNNILSITLAVIVSLTITADLYSQSAVQSENSEELFDTFETNLVYGLSSDVQGVVESTLFNMINYKIVYPGFESKRALNKVREVAKNAENHSLQYKAYLVLKYFNDQELFPRTEALKAELDHMDQDRIFLFLQDGIQSGRFTSIER